MRKTISVALLLTLAAFGAVAAFAAAPAKAKPKAKTETAVGEVAAVDSQAMTLSLKVKDQTERFTLRQNTNLTSNGKAIQLADPIKQVGDYKVKIRVAADVLPEISVSVVPET